MFEEFYGLSGRPFQLTPDPSFYFESLTHRKALSYLSYGLAQGEGFIIITGEVGAGKSTLVAHLMATIDPQRLTAGHVVTSKLGGEEIVHVVAQSFGLAVEGHDKASALGAIEGFLHEEARAGRRCLLIVDESQNLTVDALEELRMLSNFQLGAHPLLQTLLLGQPEFRRTLLDHPELDQLRQRVIATHHLEAMEAGEVRPYVEHRLKLVGWAGNPSFDDGVFASLHTASGGVPRRINQILNRLFLLGAVEQRRHIDAEMLQRVLAEFDRDGTASLVRPQTAAAPVAVASDAPLDSSAEPVAPVVIAGGIDEARLEAALAERDAHIAELQQAVLEMANHAEPGATASLAAQEDIAALQTRVALLEDRLAEQERTLRHTLTMLIEWIETADAHRAAA
ncbi:MAG TPA: XrtA/PEP-CTERM system-associated ATPase [Novosphingobium sp.]